ncbi:calcium-binding protein [Pseudanabaena sp. PCC 6802]|uniref:calcium-binding protein n=1 Tax=Pseudanabaena sp. PCC 6802 TaxID=118173 RepID=UPI00034BD2D1|nr:calcium-binding protein [Pseudanabaena sp. PCC 6802]
MAKVAEDDAREERIAMEIVVDAYGEEERAMGWYYYLDDKLSFPFKALLIEKSRTSAQKKGTEVVVVGMSPEEECLHEMFVEVEYDGDIFSMRLKEIEAPAADEDTQEAIADWHYWLARGYEL